MRYQVTIPNATVPVDHGPSDRTLGVEMLLVARLAIKR